MNFNCTLNLNIWLFLFLVFAQTTFSQGCDSSEFNCISCTDYQKCSNGSSEETIISCKSGENCADVQLKLCQIKLNCYALNECTQAGIFPDVMVDSNYYVCLDDTSSGFLKYEFSCPEGNFFDQFSLTCVLRSVTSSTSEVPTSATDPSSPKDSSDTKLPSSIIDITSSSLVTTPSIPNTPTDTTPEPVFTSISPTFTDPLTSSTATDLTSPSISTKPPSSTTMPTTPTPFVCTASGIFSNPGNCKMYYRCSTSLKAFFYICPGNSYFNENILKCSLIISPTCQEQIIRNSSSVPPPVTTPITIATTTLKPTTTNLYTTSPVATPLTTTFPTPYISTSKITLFPTFTTSTQATANSLVTTPVSCTAAGTFANPLDCKTYYRCSLSGKIFRYVCPGNTYFNEFTQRCSLIITARCKSLM